MHSSKRRNLVVCCDGTGNVWSPGRDKTNVAKLYEALEKSDGQLTYYDPGVGTADGTLAGDGSGGLRFRDTLQRVGGLAFGDGVWTNVAEAYTFLLRNYREGDRIFLFGFSRGAFTVRALSGLVLMFGLLRQEHENLIASALRIYRSKNSTKKSKKNREEAARDFKSSFAQRYGDTRDVPIHFIGVWDTVESVGIWQFIGASITSDPTVKPGLHHVRHALALDELRWPFKPRLYSSPVEKLENHSYKQVWFRGSHSDVGGGYKDDSGLANITLGWMAHEALGKALVVDTEALTSKYQGDALATLHSEITSMPMWVLTGMFGRELPAEFVIHDSVMERTRAGDPPPLTLPTIYSCEETQKSIPSTNNYLNSAPGQPRHQHSSKLLLLTMAICTAIASAIFASGGARARQLALDFQPCYILGACQDLGSYLEAFPSGHEEVLHLLRLDGLFIFFYSISVILLLFYMLQWRSQTCYPSKHLGRLACFSAVGLPLADVAKNTLSAWAIQTHLQEAISVPLLPIEFWIFVYSAGTSMFVVMKFVLLASLAFVLLYTGASALTKGRRVLKKTESSATTIR